MLSSVKEIPHLSVDWLTYALADHAPDGYEYTIGANHERYNISTRQRWVLCIGIDDEPAWLPLADPPHERVWTALLVSEKSLWQSWDRTLIYMKRGTQQVIAS